MKQCPSGKPNKMSDDQFITLSGLIRKHGFPKRTTYGWKDAGLFPFYQVNRTILVREAEVLNALERFKHIGKISPVPGQKKMPVSPGHPKKHAKLTP
jgi:hypothetical protein